VPADTPIRPGGDSSLRLPPGALPPPVPPKPKWTWRRWWWVNREWVVVSSIIVAVLVGIWFATSVPVVSLDHPYQLAIVPELLAEGANYWGYDFVMVNSPVHVPATVSGTYWTAVGNTIHFVVELGSSLFQTNGTSGSYHLSSSDSLGVVTFYFYAHSPTTVYVNGTLSCLVPLSYVI